MSYVSPDYFPISVRLAAAPTTAAAGEFIICQPGVTITLPPLADVPDGGTITLFASDVGVDVTAGADPIAAAGDVAWTGGLGAQSMVDVISFRSFGTWLVRSTSTFINGYAGTAANPLGSVIGLAGGLGYGGGATGGDGGGVQILGTDGGAGTVQGGDGGTVYIQAGAGGSSAGTSGNGAPLRLVARDGATNGYVSIEGNGEFNNDNEVLRLTTSGGSVENATVSMFVGQSNPSGVTAVTGSVYFRADGVNSNFYVNRSIGVSGTDWEALGSSLQLAYDNGGSIDIDVTPGSNELFIDTVVPDISGRGLLRLVRNNGSPFTELSVFQAPSQVADSTLVGSYLVVGAGAGASKSTGGTAASDGGWLFLNGGVGGTGGPASGGGVPGSDGGEGGYLSVTAGGGGDGGAATGVDVAGDGAPGGILALSSGAGGWGGDANAGGGGAGAGAAGGDATLGAALGGDGGAGVGGLAPGVGGAGGELTLVGGDGGDCGTYGAGSGAAGGNGGRVLIQGGMGGIGRGAGFASGNGGSVYLSPGDIDPPTNGGNPGTLGAVYVVGTDSNTDADLLFALSSSSSPLGGTPGANTATAGVYVGTRDPAAATITANPGALYVRVDGINSTVYVNNGAASGATWTTLLGGGGGTADYTDAAPVKTTDATTATVLSYTTTTNDRAIIIKALVWGLEPTTGDRITANITVSAYRNGAGTVTVDDESYETFFTVGDGVNWSIDFNVSGADIDLDVTGEAATTIEWRAQIEVSEHG